MSIFLSETQYLSKLIKLFYNYAVFSINMQQFEYTTTQYKKTDYATLAISVIGLVFFLFLFFSDRAFNLIFGGETEGGNGQQIGLVAHSENDVRRKSSNSFAWQSLGSSKEIRLGDGIFTGAHSKTQIQLNTGNQVDLSENSMVIFSRIDGFDVPDLDTGNVKLTVKGKMKVAIGGKLTELEGDGLVQVVLDKNQNPKVELLSGHANIKTNKSAGFLTLNKNAKLTLNHEREAKPLKRMLPPTPSASEVVKISSIAGAQTPFVYIDRINDLYEGPRSNLNFRDQLPESVELKHQLQWKLESGSAEHFFIQNSPQEDFKGKTLSAYESTELSYNLPVVYVGDNYWKVSHDGENWSEIQKFHVTTQLLSTPPPKLTASSTNLTLNQEKIQTQINIDADVSYTQFVVEMSQSPKFHNRSLRIQLQNKSVLTPSFISPGKYYLRVRGVNQATEISDYSNVVAIQINKPPFSATPILALNKNTIYLGEKINLAWNQTESTKSFQIQMKDSNGRTVYQTEINNTQLSWTPPQIGNFQVEVRSIHNDGRPSTEITNSPFNVLPRPLPVAKPAPPPQRQIASTPPPEGTNKTGMMIPADYMNRTPTTSRFNLEGALFTMYSTSQQTEAAGLPVAALGGLRYFRWTDVSGFEGIFRSKVFGLSPEAQDVSPLLLEARYHLLWNLGWNPFSQYGGSKFSLLAGFEMYRNTKAGLYANQYQLLKTGFTLFFPISKKWDTGGEVLYGKGFDNSTKYEISGFLDYFLSHDLSLGAGYRIHLFEAGSSKSFPAGVSEYFEGYREGYGEAYSALRWHLK